MTVDDGCWNKIDIKAGYNSLNRFKKKEKRRKREMVLQL
jgi:hypothetical protein